MITREQQADLRPGDVVELTFTQEYDATTITARGVFPAITNWYDNYLGGPYTLTVVSRAPRPLYVNHNRASVVAGDVVRNADTDDVTTWTCHGTGNWTVTGKQEAHWGTLPAHLRLLVDGETGLPPAVTSR